MITLIRCIGCGLPLGEGTPSHGALEHVRTCAKHPLAKEIAGWKKGVEDANRISQRERERSEKAERILASLVSDEPDSKFDAEIVDWRRRVLDTVKRNVAGASTVGLGPLSGPTSPPQTLG